MPKSTKGPFVCVFLKSVRSNGDEKTVSVSSWKPWLVDLGAMDQLSPAWLRKGPKANMSELFQSLESFAAHCQALLKKKDPEARLEVRTDANSERQVGLLALTLRLESDCVDKRLEAAQQDFASVALGELRKLAAKGRSKVRPTAKLWREAPPSANDYWVSDIIRVDSGGKSALWAAEFCSAIEAEDLTASLSNVEAPAAKSRSL